MKTKLTNSLNVATILVLVVLTFVSCGNKQQKTFSNDKDVLEVKAPSSDIHSVVFMGDIKSVKQHIVAGTNLNAKDQYGSTPLTIAVTFGKTEIAKALILGGADLNLKNNEGSTALHTASFFCRTEIVKVLLEQGADKTLENNYGATALESVASSFKEVKPIYEQIAKQLGPLGLKLDFKFIEATRPVIADMLK